jgi:hypothetical protein
MQEQWPSGAVFETLHPDRKTLVGMPSVFDEDGEGGAITTMLPDEY